MPGSYGSGSAGRLSFSCIFTHKVCLCLPRPVLAIFERLLLRDTKLTRS